MLTNRMVNTLLFETKLPFASSCGSTWPHCNTIYCRWGRYIPRTSLAKMLHIYGDRQLDRVPTHSRKLREMAFPWKIREISGIYQAPQGMFENNKISGNSHRPEVRKLLLFVKLEELHIVTARKPLIHQNQPVAKYLHKIQPCML